MTTTYSDSDGIDCPWCGEHLGDLWDYNWSTAELVETECGYCDKPITLMRSISVSYTAKARAQ